MRHALTAALFVSVVLLSTETQPNAAQLPTNVAGTALAQPRGLAVLRAIHEDLDHVPGELIVKFRPGSEGSSLARIMSVASPDGAAHLGWVGDLALMAADPVTPLSTVLARLRAQPEVEYAHPNYLYRLHSTPNDPGLAQQWNFTSLEMSRAWDINPGAPDVVVAVIDSGVTNVNADVPYTLWTGTRFERVLVPYRVNPDLDLTRFVPGADMSTLRIPLPDFTAPPVLDTRGHGTHVAGTILQSTNNNLGFAGMAYNARLMPVKSCFSYWDAQFYQSALGSAGFVPPTFAGGCITSDVIAGIRFAADSGAKVINLSLGGPSGSPAELDAIRYAVGRGVFVSMSAGNEFEAGNPAHFPAAWGPQIPGAMTVGAVGRGLLRAYYSNTGDYVEIAAPGGDTRESGSSGFIWQAGLAPGDFDPRTIITPRFDRYVQLGSQGTSMAAPHVAGLAALLISQGITHPAAVEAAIARFAQDLGASGRDPQYGQGLIAPRATLRGLGLAR